MIFLCGFSFGLRNYATAYRDSLGVSPKSGKIHALMIERISRFSFKAAAIGALLACLPGCQVWNAWLDMLKWKDPAAKAHPVPTPIPMATVAPTPGMPMALMQRVTVYKITLPVGTFSANDKAWAQLNEDALDSRTTVLMAQNGLRAATGPMARWPIIAKLLDTPGATTDQVLCQTDGRSSINVVTHANVSDQIVVSVDRDLQQQCRSFERCDNGFRLSMQSLKGKPELIVQLEPVVTLGAVAVGAMRAGFTSEESFSDLRMAASVNPDHFLVVSAIDPKVSRFSVGTLWLADLERVPAMETVLVFVPTPK